MTSKALAYAENTLGVHTVYQQALDNRTELDKVLTELSEQRDIRRGLEQLQADAEMEVVIEQRGKHPDMAVTRWDKHIKEAFQQNDVVRTVRQNLAAATSTIEGLEYDRTMLETDIKIAIGRMNELGGYFHYLAEVKKSQQLPTTPGDTA